ncbi:hypothetical protein B0J13DRAFT_132131 [Dactylonectria estremocensis]|uniref:Enoyl reductase (ER) domain-containing protein n=1 Tax=Dactylonectria estremocensis TaxID=1079267 RepID=A0A9P9E2M1_9HYPO|nr:hypothetical protein B0J13DRAFT_132131 [Dactylonectria estremocensis]
MSGITCTAVVQRIEPAGSILVEEQVQLPSLQEHQVLVRVVRAAFNPTDAQAFDVNAFGNGAVLGCDFAGIVEEAHPTVTRYKKGDRISALVWGGEKIPVGAYSQYCIADERIAFPVAPSLDLNEAVTIPLATATAWLALLSKGCLDMSQERGKKTPVLIWGGGSTVGSFTIQLARILGLEVITTCSPRSFEVVKRHGATHAFDYKDADVVDQIQKCSPGLKHAFDTIGNAKSSTQASASMGANNGNVCTVRPGKAFTEGVASHIKITDVFVFTAFLKEHTYRQVYHWPVLPEDHKLTVELYEQIPKWVEQGTFKPQRPRKMGKLSADTVATAMQLYRDNALTNEKCVFDVGDI